MLGASIYLSSELSEIKNYLTNLSKNGVVEVFTSIHIGEEDTNGTLEKLREVSKHINNLEMQLMIDVSSATLTKYNFTFEEMIEFLKEIGVKKLRLDYGFDLTQIKTISENFSIVLNASTLDREKCEELKSIGIELKTITACHNFYPRIETGLGSKILLEQNILLRDLGVKIQAFIPGDEKLRGPLFEGLPTLEKHRGVDPLFAYIDLIENYMVDEVLVGDISIKQSTLARIQAYENGEIQLRLKEYFVRDERIDKIFFNGHRNRKDVSDYVVRSATTRIDIDFPVKEENCIKRTKGTITIDNEKYGRYNGEIQITRLDLQEDDRVNVIGKIVDEDIPLLDFIQGGTKFSFIKERV